MKLNAGHISRVEGVLADQQLIFKDFENEMVDHICSVIENEYTEDADFEVALHNELHSFSDYFFESNNILQSGTYYTGIKALEMERFKEIDYEVKRAFVNILKTQLLTLSAPFWILIFYLLNKIQDQIGLETNHEGLFFSDFIAGAMLPTFVFALIYLISHTPTYRSDSISIFNSFPKLQLILRPSFGYLHSIRKLCWLPLGLFSIYVNISYWWPSKVNALKAFLIFSIFLSVYILVKMYFDFKSKNQLPKLP